MRLAFNRLLIGADSFYTYNRVNMMGVEGEINNRAAYVAVLMMGVVSMLGDICYESGRGIAPDYLRFLGASAFVVGAVSGAGEFIGYGARLLSGRLADRSHAYWFFIFLGYGLILSVPLMGFTTSVEAVMLLLLLERLGKALRSPSRDTVVSIVSKGVGRGRHLASTRPSTRLAPSWGPPPLGR